MDELPMIKADCKKALAKIPRQILCSRQFQTNSIRRQSITPIHIPMDATEQALRQSLSEKSSALESQGNAVRALKASRAAKPEIDPAIELLNKPKLEKTAVEKQLHSTISSSGNGSLNPEAFRQAVANNLERGLFCIPSFKIYGGVAGLTDYGPPGCVVKSNVLSLWRQHFILEENMLEVHCPCATPEVVLKTSGHVDNFTDLVVKDEKTGTCYLADHLLKDYCTEKLEKDLTISAEEAAEFKDVLAVMEDYSPEELGAKLKEYGITAPDTKNPLSDPYPYNLMFQTSIGPSGSNPGYMRPETAQGIFVNFKDLYYYNGRKLPFAAAQIGQVFRNEISPRQGLLRAREFTLAEIEHFVDPENKSHPKFSDVSKLEFLMFPREEQLSGQSAKKLFLGEAVAKGTVNNETLGYFIGRVYLFLTRLGIDKERLRFRQHLTNEMAHYASDCWDAEIESSYGWIECVGIADRSDYDLRAHSEKSGVALVAEEKYAEPKEVEKLVINPVKKELGLAFKRNQKNVVESLEAMNEEEAMEMKATLESKGEVEFYVCTLGENVSIKKNMVSISKEKKKEHQRVFTPSVIEPSFGIGRIIHCLYEHCFSTRPSKAGDEQLNVFRFPPLVAPLKCTVTEQSLRQSLSEKSSSVVKQLQSTIISSGNGSLNRDASRQAVVNILERRLFYIPSFKIYGGVAGLYDYGPPGCAVKANVLSLWHQHFILEENMLEVDGPCLTPEVVLKASGHVDKFTDLMVKDEKTGTCYRADHLLKDYCTDKLEKDLTISAEKAAEFKDVLAVMEGFSPEELGAKLKEYGITAPDTKNPLSDPYPFNLMFQTSIGPSGLNPGYMRPETAQGIFVNFKDLYYYKVRKLPFAAAQIGQAFRNEISPRQGLLRVREFTLAEIEHFVDPENKSHPKFSDVSKLEFLMFPREEQMSGQSAKKICLGEAVAKGTVNNETLGYFIGRVYLFLTRLGIDKERLRFRQHLANEMAHYAADCWDAEIESSYGWIECVGIADRSAYDLHAHTEKSGVALVAEEKYAEPKEVEKLVINPVKKELGLAFKGNQKNVVESLEAMNEEEAMEMKATLESKGEVELYVCTLGENVSIKKNMVSISKEKKKEHQRVFTPSVIEPSFGIGRIIYCLYEHCFSTRPSKAGDEQLNVFRFPPLVAPLKCTVFPLVQNQQFEEATKVISKEFTSVGISHKIDITGTSIGKRYARTDELGVPFAITVDSDTSVTIRERDSKDQVRVSLKEAASVVSSVVEGEMTWLDVWEKFPHHSSAAADE